MCGMAEASRDPLRGKPAAPVSGETRSLRVFTDGASSPDGRGGWAYVVVKDGIEIMRGQGSALRVTHQLMEIRAVAEGLLAAPTNVPVKVVGDSAYVIDCFRYGWHLNWESNGWKNYSNKPVANRDEWERLLAALRAREAETTWKRIKGHNGQRWNEIVDALAVEAKGYHSGGAGVVRQTTVDAPRTLF
jgi:ribonuclease HI